MGHFVTLTSRLRRRTLRDANLTFRAGPRQRRTRPRASLTRRRTRPLATTMTISAEHFKSLCKG